MIVEKSLDKGPVPCVPTSERGVQRRLLTQHKQVRPFLSIIVPTMNERENVAAVLTRIDRAMRGEKAPYEVVFVDDSTDDTPQVIEQASQEFSFDITLITRVPRKRTGLGTAVVEGMRIARGDWVCVMDGDLQHPPELIPKLLAKAERSGVDLVTGSRLAAGGGTDGLGTFRTFVSYVLAFTSRSLFPTRLKKLSDPLTGFFLFRRQQVDPEQLQPQGFKILLEILVRCPQLNVAEVPFTFGERHGGQSKACTRQILHLIRHYARLLAASHIELIRFGTVGAVGIAVNSLALVMFTELFGIYYLLSAILATQLSTLSNFGGTEWWVFNGRQQHGLRWRRLLSFFAMNNAALLLRGPFLALLVSQLGIHYLVANLLSLVLFTLIRFGLSDRVIWRQKSMGVTKVVKVYHYNIHDIIRIRSMQRLPELGYFETTEPTGHVDIEVRIAKNMAAYKRADSICYDELPGKYGFSIVINRDETYTEVFATPTISRSPHVLYTNVIEALLRWLFVRKGYTLMHGACLSFDGKAVFITAQTDTGKTTTILHAIRHSETMPHFLSDDMTIFSQDGQVWSYPKPLTISQHTVQAIGGAPLSKKERLFLKVQSRLHSRGGRKVGMLLSAKHMPAATLNALVQMIIPPPKYMVHRLIPQARYGDTAELSHIVLIERGPSYRGEIPRKERTGILLANADDAYGFPPYPVLAHDLSHWRGKDLHERERALVEQVISELPATHLRSNRYDWYKRIPHLVEELQDGKRPSPTVKEERDRMKEREYVPRLAAGD